MLISKTDAMQAALGSILTDHFENSENPHQTIYRIWLLVNAAPLISSIAIGDDPDIAPTDYH
jgi:hypothetical protein